MRYLEQYYKTQPKPDAIIPIPLHHSRLKERGYNQAAEIARPIARSLRIPCKVDYCLRIKQTAAQSLLSINERKHNVTRAFTLARPLPYKHIAVIDDIITTGNTVREFCRTLRQHTTGLRIDVWSVART
jgi:ComF family protein